MYRPDYHKRPSRHNWFGLGVVLLLGLAIGVAVVGSGNDWWGLAPGTEARASATVAAVSTTPTVSPTPFATATAMTSPSPAGERLFQRKPPPFTLPDLYDDGLRRSLADYAGQPVILNFWASWCVPCRAEMPALQRAYERHQADRLVVLGVNQTFIDDLGAARAFVWELSLTFPSVRDDSGDVSSNQYRVVGLPTSVFVTPEGTIAHVQVGQMSDEQVETYSRRLVAGETIVP